MHAIERRYFFLSKKRWLDKQNQNIISRRLNQRTNAFKSRHEFDLVGLSQIVVDGKLHSMTKGLSYLLLEACIIRHGTAFNMTIYTISLYFLMDVWVSCPQGSRGSRGGDLSLWSVRCSVLILMLIKKAGQIKASIWNYVKEVFNDKANLPSLDSR